MDPSSLISFHIEERGDTARREPANPTIEHDEPVMVLVGAVFPSTIAGVPTAPFAGSKEFAPAAAPGMSDTTGLAISVGTCGTIGFHVLFCLSNFCKFFLRSKEEDRNYFCCLELFAAYFSSIACDWNFLYPFELIETST